MSIGRQDRLRRWQEEVARDPGADAFVPLGDLYRAQGRLEVARRVVHRGLERNPEHVDGHYVLGRIYRDSDDPERAYDEWDIALRLDPEHLPSRRAIAFLCLEQGEVEEAVRHLRKAAELDPDDPRLRRALGRAEQGAAVSPGPAYWGRMASPLEDALDLFIRESRVQLALIIDPTGQVVAQHGFTRELDIAAFASLAAGVHAASGEIARVLGQPGFGQLYQGHGEHQIFLGELQLPIGSLLLLTVFGTGTTVGLVRALFFDLIDHLDSIEWPAATTRASAEDLESDLETGLFRAVERGGARSAGRPR